ncbi:MAG: substrate-binding domain-containing protein, partial [Deltaproteobacteria bacterium]|nr:substrate-binding domain-containing protein [Deltaproteobacteria bacterium]
SKGLAFVPIGRDALVFVAGSAVSVRGVTSVRMADTFAGRITDWRELGGRPGPIRAIGRESGDSSRKALASRIDGFRDISYGPGVKVVLSDPQVLTLLDRFDTSLGFLNRSAVHDARTKVVPLALDGVEPTPANLESGRYPVWLELGLVHKAGVAPEGAARAFMDFLASPDGIRILLDHGVLPFRTGGR